MSKSRINTRTGVHQTKDGPFSPWKDRDSSDNTTSYSSGYNSDLIPRFIWYIAGIFGVIGIFVGGYNGYQEDGTLSSIIRLAILYGLGYLFGTAVMGALLIIGAVVWFCVIAAWLIINIISYLFTGHFSGFQPF